MQSLTTSLIFSQAPNETTGRASEVRKAPGKTHCCTIVGQHILENLSQHFDAKRYCNAEKWNRRKEQVEIFLKHSWYSHELAKEIDRIVDLLEKLSSEKPASPLKEVRAHLKDRIECCRGAGLHQIAEELALRLGETKQLKQSLASIRVNVEHELERLKEVFFPPVTASVDVMQDDIIILDDHSKNIYKHPQKISKNGVAAFYETVNQIAAFNKVDQSSTYSQWHHQPTTISINAPIDNAYWSLREDAFTIGGHHVFNPLHLLPQAATIFAHEQEHQKTHWLAGSQLSSSFFRRGLSGGLCEGTNEAPAIDEFFSDMAAVEYQYWIDRSRRTHDVVAADSSTDDFCLIGKGAWRKGNADDALRNGRTGIGYGEHLVKYVGYPKEQWYLKWSESHTNKGGLSIYNKHAANIKKGDTTTIDPHLLSALYLKVFFNVVDGSVGHSTTITPICEIFKEARDFLPYKLNDVEFMKMVIGCAEKRKNDEVFGSCNVVESFKTAFAQQEFPLIF